MLNAIFNSDNWAGVPFHFWSFVFFCFGSVVGSFLNVCIHRMPLDQSVVSPPSHCPHCGYSIPWYLNIPLVTWVYLGGQCRNCGAHISVRYFLVELLTALCFMSCWLVFGRQSAALALVYCLFLAGLIVATFIDFEHYIIPDEVTIGGMLVGFLLSFLVPRLHEATSLLPAMKESLLGMAAGAGIIYAILRLGKLMFGRQKLELPEQARIIFGETALKLPDKEIPYEDLFYRDSDAISFRASRLEMADRCYKDVAVKLKMATLTIGEETLNPAEVPYLEAMASQIVLPREAMGFGDVKFMGAIGAFLGWKAVVFTLMASSVLGSIIGVGSLVLRKEGGSRLPYGPYIAMAAAIWVFVGKRLIGWWLGGP